MLIPSWTPVHAENEVSMNFEYEGYKPGSSYLWYGNICRGEITVFDATYPGFNLISDDMGVVQKATYNYYKPLKEPNFILFQLKGIETKITVTVGGESKELTSIPETTSDSIDLKENFKVGDIPFLLRVTRVNFCNSDVYQVIITNQDGVDYKYTEDINIKIVSTVKDFKEIKEFSNNFIEWMSKKAINGEPVILDQVQEEGFKKIRESFKNANSLDDIYQARRDLQEFLNADLKRIRDNVDLLEESVTKKIYKADADGYYLLSDSIITNLLHEIGKYEFMPTKEEETWQKYVERLKVVEQKADIELKKS